MEEGRLKLVMETSEGELYIIKHTGKKAEMYSWRIRRA